MFRLLFSCNFDDKLSSNLHMFVYFVVAYVESHQVRLLYTPLIYSNYQKYRIVELSSKNGPAVPRKWLSTRVIKGTIFGRANFPKNEVPLVYSFRGELNFGVKSSKIKQLRVTRVFFLTLLSRNFDDPLSSNFHRFVVCICWDTPSEKTGLWQNTNSVYRFTAFVFVFVVHTIFLSFLFT